MAENDLTLTTQWPQTLDEDYARRRLDAEMEALLAEGPPAYEIRGKPGQGTQDVSPPGTQPPSALAAGVTAGVTAAGEGAKNVMQGLVNLFSMTPAPGETLPEQVTAGLKGKVDSAKQVLMDGLMQLGLSPLTGGFVGVGQALENTHPDVAAAPVADGMAAAGIRGILSGRAFKDLSPEEQAAAVQPLTVREALEMAGPMLAPALAGPAIRGAKKVGASAAQAHRGGVEAMRQTVTGLVPHVIPEPRKIIAPAHEVTQAVKEPGFVYHATNLERAGDIADSGNLRTHRPSEFTDQQAWPDGSTQKRSYFSGDPHVTSSFAPPEGKAVFLRVSRDAAEFKKEASTGDIYARKEIPAGAIEYLGTDGQWHPLNDLRSEPPKSTRDVLLGERGAIGPNPPPEGAGFKAGAEGEPRGAGRATPPPPGEAPPPGAPPGAGGGEARINVERHIAPESVKRLMEGISRIVGEREPLKTSRERVSHAETIEVGRAWSLDQILGTDPGDVTVKEARGYQQAARDHFNAAHQYLDSLAKLIEQGDAAAEAAWDIAYPIGMRLSEIQEILGTEGARLMEARKILGDASRVRTVAPEALAGIAERQRQGQSAKESAAQWLSLTKGARRTWLRKTWDGLKAGYDIAHEVWIQGLLSNPLSTDVANVLGSVGTILVDLPETYAAEVINRIRRDPMGTRPGEAWAKTTAIGEGLVDGVRLAGKALQEQSTADAVQKQLLSFTNKAGEQRGFFRASTFGMDPESAAAMAVNALIPTTRMAAEDAIFKGTAYTMSIRAQAFRHALMEGKTSPAGLAKRKSELFDTPTPQMIAEGVDDAKRLTMNQPLGPFGQAVNKVIELSVVGPWIVPFRSISGNVMKWFGQRAPILAQISSTNRADMAAGGVRADKAIARQLTGVAVTSAVMYLVAQGKITGGGNPDRALKRMEREEQPTFSVRVGDVWVKYDRYDPVGALVGAVADYAELLHYIPNQDALDEWAAYGEALVLAAGHVMINKTYMRGLADAFNAIKEPDRQGAAWMKQFAGSLVPASSVMRAVTRALDDQVVRDARTIVDKLKAGIPFLADGVPPLRNNITGEAFRYGIGGPSPLIPLYVYTEKKNDPVILEILRNRIDLAPVPWVIGGGSAKSASDRPQMTEPMQVPPTLLTPKQRDFWIVEMTQKVKLGAHDDTLYQALDRAMRSDEYRTLSPEDRGGYFRAIYGAYRQVGFANLLNPEIGSKTLEAKMLQRAEEVGRRHLPTDNPDSPYFGGANPSRLNRRLPGSLTR